MDWDELLQEEAMEEYAGSNREQLPPNAWCVGSVETNPDLDWAIAKTRKAGEYFVFEAGLRCFGGDAKVEEDKHQGQIVRVSAFIHPFKGGKGPDEKGLLSGKFKGLLTSLLVPGVGGMRPSKKEDRAKRSEERIKALYATLNAAAKKHKLEPSQFDGDKARFLASCAVHELRDRGTERTLVFKTVEEKDRNDPEKVYIKVGTWDDDTPEVRDKYGVTAFSKEEVAF